MDGTRKTSEPLQGERFCSRTGRPASERPRECSGVDGTRTRGLRRDRASNSIPHTSIGLQRVEIIQDRVATDFHESHALGPVSKNFVTFLLQGAAGALEAECNGDMFAQSTNPQRSATARVGRKGLRIIDAGAERLLSVRDVADRLGVCPRTVYELCERSQLPHVRVSNAIRIAPKDLNAFIQRHTK